MLKSILKSNWISIEEHELNNMRKELIRLKKNKENFDILHKTNKDYEEKVFDGDVKYHLGWTSKRMTDNGNRINLNIAPNPSHLETVGSVVEGITRSKQDKYYSDDFSKVLP